MRKLRSIRAAVFAAALAVSGGAMSGGVWAQEAPALRDSAPATSVLPWYQEYVQSGGRFDLNSVPLDRSGSTVEWDTGANWGVMFGLDGVPGRRFERDTVDGVSAGAFFRVSPRVRVGGELGFRPNLGEAGTLRPAEPGSSQIKLESAFRF